MIFDNYLTEAADMDIEPVVEGEEAMELEQSEGEEEGVEENKGENIPEQPTEPALVQPEQAAETAEDTEQVAKPVPFLPRNKEELECLIKHIQDTVVVNILPKLHRLIVAKVRSWHWKGSLQAGAATVRVEVVLERALVKCNIFKKKKKDKTGERLPEKTKEASSHLACHQDC